MQREVEIFLSGTEMLKCSNHSLPIKAVCLNSKCPRFLICSLCTQLSSHTCGSRYIQTIEAIKKYILADLVAQDPHGELKCREKLQKILSLMKAKEKMPKPSEIQKERKVVVSAYENPLVFEHQTLSRIDKKDSKRHFGYWCN